MYGSKQERPLKYETTRPVSAPKSKTNNDKPTNGTKGSKVNIQGSKVTQDNVKVGRTTYNATESINRVKEENKLASKSENALDISYEEYIYDDDEDSEEEERPEVDPDIAHLLRVDIKKPESVIRYEDEVARMKLMEEEFQRTTLSLQKKLGIASSGLVWGFVGIKAMQC